MLKLILGMIFLNVEFFMYIYIINMLIYIIYWINFKWKLLKIYLVYIFIKIILYFKVYNIYVFLDILLIEIFLYYFLGNNYDFGSIIRICCWNIYVFVLVVVLKWEISKFDFKWRIFRYICSLLILNFGDWYKYYI